MLTWISNISITQPCTQECVNIAACVWALPRNHTDVDCIGHSWLHVSIILENWKTPFTKTPFVKTPFMKYMYQFLHMTHGFYYFLYIGYLYIPWTWGTLQSRFEKLGHMESDGDNKWKLPDLLGEKDLQRGGGGGLWEVRYHKSRGLWRIISTYLIMGVPPPPPSSRSSNYLYSYILTIHITICQLY